MNPVFHYTTLKGFLGIVESGSLYATSIRFLSDTSEIRFGIRHLAEMLKDAQQEICWTGIAGSEDLKANFPIFAMMTRILSEREDGTFQTNPMVFSFSLCEADSALIEKNGLLSQWNLYGSGGGVAIEFDTTKLVHDVGRFFDALGIKGYAIENVRYCGHDSAVQEFIDTEINNYWMELALRLFMWETTIATDWVEAQGAELVASMPAQKRVDKLEEFKKKAPEGKEIFENLISSFTRTAALLKHPAFHQEREKRILIAPLSESERSVLRQKLQFRENGELVIPFFPIFERRATKSKAAQLPISRIIVGPYREQKRRAQGISLFLESRGYNVNIDLADIPMQV
jgi:hypothetical protein